MRRQFDRLQPRHLDTCRPHDCRASQLMRGSAWLLPERSGSSLPVSLNTKRACHFAVRGSTLSASRHFGVGCGLGRFANPARSSAPRFREYTGESASRLQPPRVRRKVGVLDRPPAIRSNCAHYRAPIPVPNDPARQQAIGADFALRPTVDNSQAGLVAERANRKRHSVRVISGQEDVERAGELRILRNSTARPARPAQLRCSPEKYFSAVRQRLPSLRRCTTVAHRADRGSASAARQESASTVRILELRRIEQSASPASPPRTAFRRSASGEVRA
jgi:hypothetical protein